MKRTVLNLDDKTGKTFFNDADFLSYARSVYKEYEEGQPYPSEIYWMPENIPQATEYIEEYCSNLVLLEEQQTNI